MKEGPDITSVAALVGDPARANMLSALMSGLALTAGELAREANVTAPTASAHLSKLREANLVTMVVQGRHRYFKLAGSDVAAALEGLMDLAARIGNLRARPGPRDAAMRAARVCYDHLAGTAGVRLYDALIASGAIVASSEGLRLSPVGRVRFIAEGIDIDAIERKGKMTCRACLDWSERRSHLAGPLAKAFLDLFLARGWVHRETGGRAIRFSPAGQVAFEAIIALQASDRARSTSHSMA
jgi:DNA-binding transcriptional ArsR family regulator